jgi:hypothetical protein
MFNGMSPPLLHVRQPTNNSDSLLNVGIDGDRVDNEKSSWQCCQCGVITPIGVRHGQHPLGALACECPHKPCASYKIFLPIGEPATMPIEDMRKEIPFGVICL